MDGKTKDAIKQLQAEMRQLHAIISSQHIPAAQPIDATEIVNGGGIRREKDIAVSCSVSYRLPGSSGAKAGTQSLAASTAQLSRVKDDQVAVLGGALSSPHKVALLRALLDKESEAASVLGEITTLTTGSLYHHLRDLMHAGLISQAERNRYSLTERGTRVLLVLLALSVQP